MGASDHTIEIGEVVPPRRLETIDGEQVSVPDPSMLTHLQFRRFASCPFCNLHLRTIEERHGQIEAAGVREIVVFYSSANELRDHQREMPFAIIADPDRELYLEFGVGSSLLAGIHPRALRSAAQALRVKRPGMDVRRGPFGLPADFLIDRDGRVIACKYGDVATDQWSVDELLEHVPSTA